MIKVCMVDSMCDIFYIAFGNRGNRYRSYVIFDRRELVQCDDIEEMIQRKLAVAVWSSMPVHDH